MHIWTEWDRLNSIIVGDTSTDFKTDDQKIDSYLKKILEETKEDFDNLARLLQAGGIKVYRPTTSSSVQNVMPPMVPRDQYLIYGNNIYSTFTSMKERYYDQYYYYDIFVELFENGYNWLQQPIPDIPKLSANEAWFNNGREIYSQRYKNKLLLHTATASKAGKNLIINPKGPSTHLGRSWLQRNLPAGTSLIENNDTAAYGWGHIDQCWFMTDDETVVCLDESWVPTCLKNKKIIEIKEYISFPDLSKYVTEMKACGGKFTEEWMQKWFSEWRGYAQDVCFDTNVLMLDHNKILLSNPQPTLERFLESQGIECYSARLRHGLFWESGIHCCTLDVSREGQLRSII